MNCNATRETYGTKLISVCNNRKLCDASTSEFYYKDFIDTSIVILVHGICSKLFQLTHSFQLHGKNILNFRLQKHFEIYVCTSFKYVQVIFRLVCSTVTLNIRASKDTSRLYVFVGGNFLVYVKCLIKSSCNFYQTLRNLMTV